MFKHIAAVVVGSVLASTLPCGRSDALAASTHVAGYKLATWNIAMLATPGRKMFGPKTLPRSDEDFEKLRLVRDRIGADVYVLQEISSPAALAMVFPPGDYDLCLSGQWSADAKGLAPLYPSKKVNDEKIAPVCLTPGQTALDTEGPDALLRQYVAVAVRKSSGITIAEKADVPSLSVMVLDKVDRDAQPTDTVLRNLRWGLEVVLAKDGRRTRLLAVHQKSSCTDDSISFAPIPLPDQYGAEAEPSCAVVSRQLPKLKAWFDQASAKPEPILVVGDFNRRLTLEQHKVTDPQSRFWSRLTGEATPTNTGDDLTLQHYPANKGEVCYLWDGPDYVHAIDFVVAGNAHPVIPEGGVTKIRFDMIIGADGKPLAPADKNDPRYPKGTGKAFWEEVHTITDRLSDHCPRVIAIP